MKKSGAACIHAMSAEQGTRNVVEIPDRIEFERFVSTFAQGELLMSRLFMFASLSIVVAVGVMLVGCSNQQSSQPANDRPDAAHVEPAATDRGEHEGLDHEGSAHTGHDGADHGDHADHSGQGQYAEALAKLSPEDRALAEKQKTCPVSGDPLGAMGKPYKVTVQGRDVLLCCQGCEAEIKNNPEKYLAELSPPRSQTSPP